MNDAINRIDLFTNIVNYMVTFLLLLLHDSQRECKPIANRIPFTPAKTIENGGHIYLVIIAEMHSGQFENFSGVTLNVDL